MNEKTAQKISLVTEPMTVMAMLVYFGALHAGISGWPLRWFTVLILGVTGLVWVARRRFMLTMRTNWDVSDRKKRVRLLIPLMAFCVVIAAAVMAIWQSAGLMRLAVMLLLWLAGFFLVTLKTKISGHIATLTLAIGMIVAWFGMRFGVLLALVPAVAWSRLRLGRHTPVEVVGGASYSLVMLGIFSVLSLW